MPSCQLCLPVPASCCCCWSLSARGAGFPPPPPPFCHRLACSPVAGLSWSHIKAFLSHLLTLGLLVVSA